MRFLALTFDASGNLPPLLGLVEALVAQGHAVEVMGHHSQRSRIEAAGAGFLAFDRAPQYDAAGPNRVSADVIDGFSLAARDDLLAAAATRRPDVLLVDAMLPSALQGANASPWPTAAVCHCTYGTLAEYLDGRFRAPMEASELVLVLSHEAFHSGAPAPANVAFVGPARPKASSAWSRRDPGRKLVLASLSTGDQGQEPVLRRLCQALGGVDAEVLVTTGRGISPEALPSAPNMVLIDIVPHEAVLPFADLVVTHAGHGTVMAAIGAGVPMLCLPGVGDQPANAGRVAALGLGEVMDKTAEPEALRAAIERLLADGALRRRCAEFARTIADAPGLALAVERLERLA